MTRAPRVARRSRLLLAAFLLLAPAASAVVPPTSHLPSTVPVGVPQEGPDVPAATEPDAVVTVLQDEYWHNSGGLRSRIITVPESPTGTWDRIVLEYRQYPHMDPAQQDPWDRLCSAYVAGVEVLRCTTPRTDMTLRKDITEFAALMPPGAEVRAGGNTGSYDQPQYYRGGQYVTVRLEFYADEPTKHAVPQPAGAVVPAFYHRTMCAAGAPITTTVTFPDEAPATAVAEVTLSGHGGDEFWWTDLQNPVFHLFVDGEEVGQVVAYPYIYAFLGIYGAAYTLHPLMYWTAQQLLDIVGVHTGVGEVPPYRITLLPTQMDLLTGTREVSLVGENGACYWPASVAFLLDDPPLPVQP